jgi:hypothetical protein
MTTTDVEYCLVRIDRLERSVRRWRLITLCASCIVGTFFLLGAQSRQTIVEAQRFVLIDADGKPRGSFHSDAEGPNLAMLDARGNPRVILTVTKEGPRLNLYDGAVRARIEMGVYSDFPLLRLLDERKPRLEATSMPNGTLLALSDSNGTARVGLMTNEHGNGLVLSNATGEMRALFSETDKVRLSILSAAGKVVFAVPDEPGRGK